jgi:hypothetical protein
MIPISQQNYFESFDSFAPDTASRAKEFPKEFQSEQNSFADSEAETKELKESKDFSEDKAETKIIPILGMTLKQAIAIWERKGRPVIHLGPGENCLDLERLLRHPDVNQRHLAAVREWLAENGALPIPHNDSPRESASLSDWDALEKDLDTFLSEEDESSDGPS